MTITNNPSFLMAMGAGSRIEIHAADAQKPGWSDLADTAVAGTQQLVLRDATGWEVGDRIALASTSRDWTEAEAFTVTAVADGGRVLTLDRPLVHTHRGETLQFDNGRMGQDHRAWEVDIRAEVALLSRNVTVQGTADMGGHIMAMDGAGLYLEGAELWRMGQADVLGRYPVHWHMLGDASGQYARNLSIHESFQKGITVHGTSNTVVEGNVIHDHQGHGLFLEDGSETGTHILGNLVFSTRKNEAGLPIPTDGDQVSSYWIENANNFLVGNHAGGSESNGFWIIPQADPHGLSADMDVGPGSTLAELIFVSNTGHTNDGENAADGQGKTLGIDGALDAGLAFETATHDGDFGAVIQDFTAYEGLVWALTTELVLSDSALVDSKGFFRHENLIEDTLFAREDLQAAHVQLYRDGGNQLNNVHFDGFYQMNLLGTDHSNGPDLLQNVTHSGITTDRLLNWQSEDAVYQKLVIDLDGSLTGTPGTTLVPDTELGAFKAPPGAVFDPSLNSWRTPYTVGATEVSFLDGPGSVFRPDHLRILRGDGAVSEDHPTSRDARPLGDRNNGQNDRSQAEYEFNTATGMPHDQVYLLDVDLRERPVDLILNLVQVRQGQSAIYELPGVAGHSMVAMGGVAANSLGALLAARESAYFQDDSSGSLFVRLVANELELYEDRPVVDLGAAYRAGAEIRVEISGQDTLPFGDLAVNQALLTALDQSPARAAAPVPVAQDGVGEAAHYIGYGLRVWSGEDVAQGRFEARFDTASRELSLRGHLSDTDGAYVTLLDNGQSLARLPVVQGQFGAVVTLSDAQAAALLDGALQLAHGEAVGSVTLQPSGRYDLDRPESASDTVVIDNSMALWSDPASWGGTLPGVQDIVVINPGDVVVLDQDVKVAGIIVNGGSLVVADWPGEALWLTTDYLLVRAGGRFQAGSEADLLDTDFSLNLVAGDPDFDLPVGMILTGMMPDTVFSSAALAMLEGDDVVSGDQFDNHLTGGIGADTLTGGPGADHLDGGAGFDLASYASAKSAVVADMLLESRMTGDAAGDVFQGIEGIEGSGFDDDMRGTHAANLIEGLGGHDELHGRNGDDTLSGGHGNDILLGGAGSDHLIGGPGRDRAAYYNAKAAVTVDLIRPDDNLGDAAGDSYTLVEDLQGTRFADLLLGSNGANRLLGASGDDILHGRGGDDILLGMGGDDVLLGGAGADRLMGGAGQDRAAYWTAQAGVTVDLSEPSRNAGDAAGDRFLGIEDLQGSGFGDDLRGDGNPNWINGMAGDDRLDGGAGADVLTGGAGRDVFVFGDAGAVDRVLDFTPGEDRLDLSAWGAGSLQDIAVAAIDEGGGAMDLHLAFGGYALRLESVDVPTLSPDDVFF